MKIFLSWSGSLSQQVACTFRDWIPNVIQSVRPYVSSEDIDKGTRWSGDIVAELIESRFGILCLDRSNLSAPWINFEAGVLLKTVDKAHVAPFLLDLPKAELSGPLLQFQATANDKEDIFRLVATVNSLQQKDSQLDGAILERTFNKWWPELHEGLSKIVSEAPKTLAAKQDGKPHLELRMLEEILELTRDQQRLLRSPQELIPQAYLRQAIRLHQGGDNTSRLVHIRHTLMELRTLLTPDNVPDAAAREKLTVVLIEAIGTVDRGIHMEARSNFPRSLRAIESQPSLEKP